MSNQRGRGPRSQEAGPLLAATPAALGGEELAGFYIKATTGASLHRGPRLGPIGESTVREHLPLMLHRDVRMPRAQETRERLETRTAERMAAGAGAADGGEFNDAGHVVYLNEMFHCKT